MWVEEGEFDEGDDLHLTSGESVASWAATAAGPALREVDIADFWPQSCWRKAEALPVISHICQSLSLSFFICMSVSFSPKLKVDFGSELKFELNLLLNYTTALL
jgi:hypothetical protein